MSHWNYRVIEFVSQTGERWRAIHEVYYDHNGLPWLHTVNPASIGWDVEDGGNTPFETLEKMKRALTAPILTESDFISDIWKPAEPVLAKPASALSLALLEIGQDQSFPDDLADKLLQSGIHIKTEDENAVALWVVGPMFEANPEIVPGTVQGHFFDVLCGAIHDFEKIFYLAETHESNGEALFTDEGTIPISDDDHSRLRCLAKLVGATPEHVLHFVLRDGFETSERVASAVLKAQQGKVTCSHVKVMAELDKALAVHENAFEFDLYFNLPSSSSNPDDFVEALGSTCSDATLGIGMLGKIGLMFSRSASSLIDAIVSAIRDVQAAIPGAALDRVDLAPNILGRGNETPNHT